MKRAIFSVTLAALLLTMIIGAAGCQDTPHLYNPTHWGVHFAKVFSPKDGEFHLFHKDLDRVVFGLNYYEEYETGNTVYSSR